MPAMPQAMKVVIALGGNALLTTPAPTTAKLELLRGPVTRAIAADYPDFARRVWTSIAAASK